MSDCRRAYPPHASIDGAGRWCGRRVGDPRNVIVVIAQGAGDVDRPVRRGVHDQRQRLDRHLRQQPDGVPGDRADCAGARAGTNTRTTTTSTWSTSTSTGRRSRRSRRRRPRGAARRRRGALGRAVLGRPARRRARVASTAVGQWPADEAAGAGRRGVPDDHVPSARGSSARPRHPTAPTRRSPTSPRSSGQAGPGTYFGADVPAATGEDRYAGLVARGRVPLAVAAAAQPHRVRRARRRRARTTPRRSRSAGSRRRSPARSTRRIGLVAYEGDRGSTGDRASFNGHATGDDAVAGHQLLQRRQRRQRHARHRAGAGRPQHARLRHQELRRARHPRQQRQRRRGSTSPAPASATSQVS